MPTINSATTPQTFRYYNDLANARAKFYKDADRDHDRDRGRGDRDDLARAGSWLQALRNSFDSEAWDDNANVVFSAQFADKPGVVGGAAAVTVGTLTIPCLVAGRAEITFRSTEVVPANAQGIQRCLVDGVEIPNTATQFQSTAATTITMVYTATADLAAGVHTLTFQAQALTANVDFNVNAAHVRRGRVPSK